MREKNVIVGWRTGLSARQAAEIVNKTAKFSSSIIIKNDNHKSEARSLLSLISLEATYKSRLTLIADGNDENEALKVLTDIFSGNFKISGSGKMKTGSSAEKIKQDKKKDDFIYINGNPFKLVLTRIKMNKSHLKNDFMTSISLIRYSEKKNVRKIH